MNETSIRRGRAQAVRQSAQSHLLTLREERMRKRRAARLSRNAGIADEVATGAPAVPPGPEIAGDDGDMVAIAPEPAVTDEAHDPPVEAEADGPEAAAEAEGPEAHGAADETGPADGVAPEPDAEAGKGVGPEAIEASETDTDTLATADYDRTAEPTSDDAGALSEVAPEPEDDSQPGAAPAAGGPGMIDEAGAAELMTLPGIGPGLVWMLQRAGVLTLDDMAAADPKSLAASMGLVGELLDLDWWIDCAHTARDG
ncbi:hypothetical protein HKCCE3408_06130 [Rhodobacterales bacterium HKCCE3408]|nr:hypothetical protein [Rhodobacterales bacterium HKCCE3408]